MGKSLEEMKENVKNFKAREWRDMEDRKGRQYTKKLFDEEYRELKKVFDTLETWELQMIWFLRNSGVNVENQFYDFAKYRYDLSQSFVNLDREIYRFIGALDEEKGGAQNACVQGSI